MNLLPKPVFINAIYLAFKFTWYISTFLCHTAWKYWSYISLDNKVLETLHFASNTSLGMN